MIQLSNALGAQDVFFELTMAQRNGKPFSVGEEMIHISNAFVDMLPVFEVIPREGQVPTPEQIRALPAALKDSPDTMGLLVGTVRSYREDLGKSDAIMIVSMLIGTTPERFEQYLSQLTAADAHTDFTTFCEIAALLADRGLIPESGGLFDLDALKDPELLALTKQELLKNEALVAYFGITP